jgi:beta-galactosidase
MSTVSIRNRAFYLDERCIDFLCGEFHYWRHDPRQWAPILQRFRELDIGILSTYVPWHFHEVEPGRCDFAGTTDSRRDLMRFTEIVAEYGIWLLLRPGPYTYGEWTNMGVPDRVVPYHRRHTEFRREAHLWLAAFADAIKPHLATHGGNVIAVQADNEADMWTRFYAPTLGLANTAGAFQDYLREAYNGDIGKLNFAWETRYVNFDQARATMLPLVNERGALNRYLDYRRFQYWYTTDVITWTVEQLRALGIDVPITTNVYPFMSRQDWRTLAASSAFTGVDYYAQNEFRRDSWEHREYVHQLRYLCAVSPLPVITELQAGIWHGWHYASGVLSARHYRLMAISALLAGVAGWNWYMLVNRDNWYMSPINEKGDAHPELFATFKGLVDLYHALAPGTLEKVTHTAFTLNILDRTSEIGGFRDPLRDALAQADVDYEVFDLNSGNIEKPLLLYSGGRWLAHDAQQRLLAYVEGGGTLVFFDQLPVLDERMDHLNLLTLREPDGIREGGRITLALGEHTTVEVPSWVFSYDSVGDAEPLYAERLLETDGVLEEEHLHFALSVGERVIVGYSDQRGMGKILVLGQPPTPTLLRALHSWLGVAIPCCTETTGMMTALFRRGDVFYLIAVNNSDAQTACGIQLNSALFMTSEYRARTLPDGEAWTLYPAREGQIVVTLPAKEGVVIEISPLR